MFKDIFKAHLILSARWCFIIQNLQCVEILCRQYVIERDEPLAQLYIKTAIPQTADKYSISSPLMNAA